PRPRARPRARPRQARGAAPAPDLLGRRFDPDQVDVAWCGDVTYIPTDEGWLYLASVIDLASRHLLGWSMGAHHDAALVCDALDAAVATRGRSPMPDTIFHTDRGAEYTSTACIAACQRTGLGPPERVRRHGCRADALVPPIPTAHGKRIPVPDRVGPRTRHDQPATIDHGRI